MRSVWLTTCGSFERQTRTTGFPALFEALRCQDPTIREFTTPADLVSHQHGKLNSPESKDAVIYSLIKAHRIGGPGAKAAGALLFLCARRRLYRVYWKVKHLFDREDECVGEICLAMFEKVSRWNLSNHTNVGSNLELTILHSVQERRTKWFRDQRHVAEGLKLARILTDGEGIKERCLAYLWQRRSSGPDTYDLQDPELSPLRVFLVDAFELSGSDVDLLLAKTVCNQSWQEIAGNLGQRVETVKKYFLRLKKRLRQKKDAASMSPF